MFVRTCVCALLLGAFGIASAQTQPATTQQSSARPAAGQQQLTPEQRAAAQKQVQELVQYSNQIVAQIDGGHADTVWSQASEVAKKSVSEAAFVQAVDADRAKYGTMKERKVAGVSRTVSKGEGKLPAGTYVNVNYATVFSKDAKPIRELVSFHLDPDRKWRLSGYSLQQPTAAPVAQRQ